MASTEDPICPGTPCGSPPGSATWHWLDALLHESRADMAINMMRDKVLEVASALDLQEDDFPPGKLGEDEWMACFLHDATRLPPGLVRDRVAKEAAEERAAHL